MATALAIAGLVGGGMQAYGQYQEGQAIGGAEEYNAAASETNALLELKNASVARQEIGIIRAKRKLSIGREKKAARKVLSTQEAMFAKAGVALTGSPLDVMQESLENLELDIMIGDINAEIEASRLQSEVEHRKILAEQERITAEQHRVAGREAKRAGKLRAGATLLTSAASFGSKMYAPKTPSPGTTMPTGWMPRGYSGGYSGYTR